MAAELRLLRQGEGVRLSETMSAAFFNDPMMSFLVPDDDQRVAKTRWFFETAIAYCTR